MGLVATEYTRNVNQSSLSLEARLRAENASLRDQLEELRERFEIYKRETLTSSWAPPIALRLSKSERVVLEALYRRDFVAKEAMVMVLYDDKIDDSPYSNTVAAFVSKIRRKLRPYQIPILNRWGVGYFITSADKRRLDEIAESL